MLNSSRPHHFSRKSTCDSLPHPGFGTAGRSARALQVLARALVTKLRITEDHLVAELFSGSGELSRALALEAGLHYQIVAIDSVPRPEVARPGSGEMRPVHMDPWEFARFPTCYDRIVIMDALHRVDDPASFVAEVRARLAPGASFSVVRTVPDPRFEPKLLEVMACPSTSDLDSAAVAGMLQRSGYSVRRSHAQLRRQMTWSDYLELLRSRHLPALSCLSDPQLQSRIQALLPSRAPGECLDVTHHFDIVSGSRDA